MSNYAHPARIFYVVEDAEWVIKQVGEGITKNLRARNILAKTTLTHLGVRNSVIHFGSINVFIPRKGKVNIPHKTDKVVVTYYHVLPQDNRIESLRKSFGCVDIWHTASRITRDNLTAIGVPKEKIKVIPLGVDTKLFRPFSDGERNGIREQLGIPSERTVIGSFQKDGVGWKAGFEPKMIKGPDIFCAVMEELAKNYPVFALLTGPSRGYVTRRLEKAKIPFRHFLAPYHQMPKFYNALDLYLVTSRAEGGPIAILECLATATPFVSTKVGMASDLITDGKNGLICDILDTPGIVKKTEALVRDINLRKIISANMRFYAEKYSWQNISARFYDEIYKKLL